MSVGLDAIRIAQAQQDLIGKPAEEAADFFRDQAQRDSEVKNFERGLLLTKRNEEKDETLRQLKRTEDKEDLEFAAKQDKKLLKKKLGVEDKFNRDELERNIEAKKDLAELNATSALQLNKKLKKMDQRFDVKEEERKKDIEDAERKIKEGQVEEGLSILQQKRVEILADIEELRNPDTASIAAIEDTAFKVALEEVGLPRNFTQGQVEQIIRLSQESPDTLASELEKLGIDNESLQTPQGVQQMAALLVESKQIAMDNFMAGKGADQISEQQLLRLRQKEQQLQGLNSRMEVYANEFPLIMPQGNTTSLVLDALENRKERRGGINPAPTAGGAGVDGAEAFAGEVSEANANERGKIPAGPPTASQELAETDLDAIARVETDDPRDARQGPIDFTLRKIGDIFRNDTEIQAITDQFESDMKGFSQEKRTLGENTGQVLADKIIQARNSGLSETDAVEIAMEDFQDKDLLQDDRILALIFAERFLKEGGTDIVKRFRDYQKSRGVSETRSDEELTATLFGGLSDEALKEGITESVDFLTFTGNSTPSQSRELIAGEEDLMDTFRQLQDISPNFMSGGKGGRVHEERREEALDALGF
jgi:hypothetical protein